MARRSQSNPDDQPFTPLELDVMKALWEEAAPATVQIVQKRLERERPLAYNTVQTVLNILHRKRKVHRATAERAYVYTPAVSRERAAGNALRDLIQSMFRGNPEDLVLSMVKGRQITPEKLAELERLVQKLPDEGKEDQ